MQYIFKEPSEYGFKDRNGHHGKFFGTSSDKTNHLIIECPEKLTVKITEKESEFNYYILEGTGYFEIYDKKDPVTKGDLIVIPPNTPFSFGGNLKMLLINTPHWSKEQEVIERA